MTEFWIFDRDRAMGIANFLDEAREFAERLYGAAGASWSRQGELVGPDGTWTGWRVSAYRPTASA
jgi:hypothetical protein